ncbi:unnamed protein product [Prorocentrum cordatum]|uniref:Protein YIPF n=1 Tax=Prorocentrum cordatum TaxID=2364126 RepID=A0ABN9R6M4_9DINO|nr:unnamed protein product [Polarella glacialis]
MSDPVSSYPASLSEYARLVARPRIDGAMFQIRQSDWLGHFQAWNVLYCILNIVLSILFFVLQFVSLALDAALASIVELILDSVVGLIVGVLLCHVGWFCVVKNRGCCGKLGYLAWGLVYFVFVGWPMLVGALHNSVICLVLLVPACGMLWSLLNLFRGGGASS